MVVSVVAVTVGGAAYYRSRVGAEAPAYVTQPAVRGDVIDRVEASGTLEAVTTVQVGREPGVGRGLGRPGVGLPLGQLELTDAQRTQVRQLVQQHQQQTAPLVERLRTAADARRQAVEAVPVDEGRIRAASERLAQAQADLTVQQARLRNDIYALLTPEQQQRAQQLRAERDARVGQRRQRMQQRRQAQPQPRQPA